MFVGAYRDIVNDKQCYIALIFYPSVWKQIVGLNHHTKKSIDSTKSNFIHLRCMAIYGNKAVIAHSFS